MDFLMKLPNLKHHQCLLLYSILYPLMSHVPSIQTLNRAPDYFVLCGEAYLDMREALTQSIVDESADHFKQHVEVNVHHVKWFVQILIQHCNRCVFSRFLLLKPLCSHWYCSVSWHGPVGAVAVQVKRWVH